MLCEHLVSIFFDGVGFLGGGGVVFGFWLLGFFFVPSPSHALTWTGKPDLSGLVDSEWLSICTSRRAAFFQTEDLITSITSSFGEK